MGCAILCYYFELFSSFLEWLVVQLAGMHSLLHYLDDFLFIGLASSGQCHRLLSILQDTCEQFAIPLSADKTESPVLGIIFRHRNRQVAKVFRLSGDKLVRLLSLVHLAKGQGRLSIKGARVSPTLSSHPLYD